MKKFGLIVLFLCIGCSLKSNDNVSLRNESEVLLAKQFVQTDYEKVKQSLDLITPINLEKEFIFENGTKLLISPAENYGDAERHFLKLEHRGQTIDLGYSMYVITFPQHDFLYIEGLKVLDKKTAQLGQNEKLKTQLKGNYHAILGLDKKTLSHLWIQNNNCVDGDQCGAETLKNYLYKIETPSK